MNRRRQNRANESGFTLIELLVVLLLVALMSAMILPSMKGSYEDALLRSSARKLVDVFQLANSKAVTRNEQYKVRLDATSGQYFVGATKQTAEPAVLEGRLDTRIAVEIRNPVAAESEAPTVEEPSPDRVNVIGFYPDGTADAREVWLRDREGFQLALRINPVTARVHILEQGRQ